MIPQKITKTDFLKISRLSTKSETNSATASKITCSFSIYLNDLEIASAILPVYLCLKIQSFLGLNTVFYQRILKFGGNYMS